MKKITILSLILIISMAAIILISFFIVEINFKNVFYNYKYENKIKELLSDDKEIEKKWLIDKNKIPYNLEKAEKTKIEQTYICFSPEMRVRKLNDGESYTFTIKTNITKDGMTRDETEFAISKIEYNNLVSKKEGNTIYKTRYQFLDGEYVIAIDIFEGDLEGLAYMEIEFINQDDANSFKTPEWVIKDVTADLNYKNGYLARYGIPKK